jgi:hypothetical protein
MKMKAFSGYADSIELEYNAWIIDHPNITPVNVVAVDSRLYVFYTE